MTQPDPKILRGALCLLLIGSIPASAAHHAKPPKDPHLWVKNGDSDGLTTYWAKEEGSDVIAMKGEGLVREPLDKVASVIVDTTRGTEWIDSLLVSKVVHSFAPAHFIEYDLVGIPFPFDTLIQNRDFVSDTRVTYDRKEERLTVTYDPTEDAQAPVLKDYVRGSIHCTFTLVPMTLRDQTWVVAEVHCDPKGGLPGWLINFFQEGWPRTTFERLRKQTARPDIRVVPLIASLLGR